MLYSYRTLVIAISIIVSAGTAMGDWPLQPTTPARRASVGSRELVWTSTYAILRDWHSEDIQVIAEDSTSFHTWPDGSTSGSKTNFTMESIVGPFVTFTVSSETSSGRGSHRRYVRHLGSRYPDAGDIRGLFDEIDIINALEREYEIEVADEDHQPGALFRILDTFEELPCVIRRGLIDQWTVSEIDDNMATISVVSEYCPVDSGPTAISLPIPDSKQYFFDEARRLRTTWTDLVLNARLRDSRPSLYLRDLPLSRTVPWTPPPTDYQESTLEHGSFEIPVRWNNRGLEVSLDRTGGRWTTVFGPETSSTDYGWSRDSFATVDRELVSIVGPLVTYREVRRSSDKLGSRITVQFRTTDTSEPQRVGWTPAPINTVFGDADVVLALVQSEVVSPYVGDLAPETLREIGFRGDECGIFRHIMASWAILDFANGRARVRITLPSTEEYCGDYHETFDIEIAAAEEWLESIQKSKGDSLLGLHLKGWRR